MNLRDIYWRTSILVKQPHQISELSVEISKDFNRSIELQESWLLYDDFFCSATQLIQFIVAHEEFSWGWRFPALRFQKCRNDLWKANIVSAWWRWEDRTKYNLSFLTTYTYLFNQVFGRAFYDDRRDTTVSHEPLPRILKPVQA